MLFFVHWGAVGSQQLGGARKVAESGPTFSLEGGLLHLAGGRSIGRDVYREWDLEMCTLQIEKNGYWFPYVVARDEEVVQEAFKMEEVVDSDIIVLPCQAVGEVA